MSKKKHRKVVNLQKYKLRKDIDNQKFMIAEFICISCKNRWYGVTPALAVLKEVVCPNCHEAGFVITTGQIFTKSFADKAFSVFSDSMEDIEDGDDVSVDEGKDDSNDSKIFD